MESPPLKDQILLGHGRDDNSIQFDSLPNESVAEDIIDQSISSRLGGARGSAFPLREEQIATEISGQSSRQPGSVSLRQGLTKVSNARSAASKDCKAEGKHTVSMSEAQKEVIQLTEEYYNGDFEDLDIDEDDEELVYDDDNFEEASEAAVQSAPKQQRINIDKEETIPDMRKARRTEAVSASKSLKSASQKATQSPASGSARAKPEPRNVSRSFSGQSRTRPDDKIAKKSKSPTKSTRLLGDTSKSPVELQSLKGSVGTSSPANVVGVQSFYAPERPGTQGSEIYDITNQVTPPLDDEKGVSEVHESSIVQLDIQLEPLVQELSNKIKHKQALPVRQPPPTAISRQPRKLTSRSKPKAPQGIQQQPARVVQTHRLEIAPKQLQAAVKSPKTQSKRPSGAGLLSPTSKGEQSTSLKRIANRAGAQTQQMIDQMKQIRHNRTALLNTSHNQKPSSVLALSDENKKAQNSNVNQIPGSQKAENLIYKINKNKLSMKQNADGVVVRIAKRTAKQNSQPQSDLRIRDQGTSPTENSSIEGNKQKHIRCSTGLLNQTTKDGKRTAADIDNIINVHQHFNQPSIMNFNHNEYFERQIELEGPGALKNLADEDAVQQLERRQLSMSQFSQQNVRSVPLTNPKYGRVKQQRGQQQNQANSKKHQTQPAHGSELVERLNPGYGSNTGTPERISREPGLHQYTAPFNQSPFNQGNPHGAGTASRNQEMLASQSSANGELRLLAKNLDRSQRGLSALMRPHARAASSRSPNRIANLHLNSQSQTGIYMKPPGAEGSVGRRTGMIRNLKSANPARYQLLSQRTKGLASMLSKVTNQEQLNVMFTDAQLNRRKSQSRSQRRILRASHLSSHQLSEQLLAASPDGVQTAHPEEMSTIFTKQAAALSAQNDPSAMHQYQSSPKIAVLSEPGDSELNVAAGMTRNLHVQQTAPTSAGGHERRKSVSAKRTSPKVTLLSYPGSPVRLDRKRISSRSRYERMLRNELALSQHQQRSFQHAGFYQKEDIEDQLNYKKTELNKYVAENTKLRTKNAVFQDQLKDKDKLIDELLQTTSFLGTRVEQLTGNQSTGNMGGCASVRSVGDGLVSENSGGQPGHSNMMSKALQNQQQSQKSHLNLLRLKKQVNEMKTIISTKNQELEDLQRNIKSTKIYELQEELQLYRRECMKLRKISDNALRLVVQNGKEAKLRHTEQTNQVNMKENQLQVPLQPDAESIFDQKSALKSKLTSSNPDSNITSNIQTNVQSNVATVHQASMQQYMKDSVQFGTSANPSPTPAHVAESLEQQMAMTCNGLQQQLQERTHDYNQAKMQSETAIEQAKEAEAQRREDQKVISELQALLAAKSPSQETDRNQDQLVSKLRQQVSVMQAKIHEIQTQKQEEVATELRQQMRQLQEDNERRKLHEIEATEQKLKLAGDFESTQKEFINQNAEYITLQKVVKEVQSDNHRKQLEVQDLDSLIRKLQESLTQAEARNRELREDLSRTQAGAGNRADPQLFADIKQIQDQLQNIRIDAVDERSGALSEVKSSLQKTLSTLGGSRISKLQSPNDTLFLQFRNAGTSPRRYTEKGKPRSQVELEPWKAAPQVLKLPEDAGITSPTRPATAGEKQAQQVVEIIQERMDEDEPELGLLAQLACAAQPTGGSVSSGFEDPDAPPPLQLTVTKCLTEPTKGPGAHSGRRGYAQFEADAIKIQEYLEKDDSISQEVINFNSNAPSQRELRIIEEDVEASSHLKALDQILSRPSPGGSPDTPVLGQQSQEQIRQLQESPVSQKIFEQVSQAQSNQSSIKGLISHLSNGKSEPPSSGENTVNLVPQQVQVVIDQRFKFVEPAYLPGDLGGSSVSKRESLEHTSQRKAGSMLIEVLDTPNQQSSRQERQALQDHYSSPTDSTVRIQADLIVLSQGQSGARIPISSRTQRSLVDQLDQVNHLELKSALQDTLQSQILQNNNANEKMQYRKESRSNFEEQKQESIQNAQPDTIASKQEIIEQNPIKIEQFETEQKSEASPEQQKQMSSLCHSETNPADERGMLLCAKKGLQKVVPMFSNQVFNNLTIHGSGSAEDFESHGISIMQSSRASKRSLKEVKQSGRNPAQMVSLSINSNQYKIEGESHRYIPKSSRQSSSRQPSLGNGADKAEPRPSPLQSAQEQLLNEIPSQQCITDTEQTLSPNHNTRSGSKLSKHDSNKQRLGELSISSSKMFASAASGTSGMPRPTPHFVDEGQEGQKPGLFKISTTELRAVLQTTLNVKIDEELRQAMNPEAVSKIVDSVAEIFQQVATTLKKNRMSVREAFAPQLYSTRQRGSLSPRTAQKPEEIEVLKPEPFVNCIEIQLATGKNKVLDFNQKQCIYAIFQCPELFGLVTYKEICAAFSTLTISNGKPADSEVFNFSILGLKEIRILNRLNAYLSQTQMTLNDFTSDLSRSMKTKNHNNKIEVISTPLLFERFQQAGITKSSQVDQILQEFLGIEGQVHIIHLNKLARCLKELPRHHYFMSIGLQKNKLDLQEYQQEQQSQKSSSFIEGETSSEEIGGLFGSSESSKTQKNMINQINLI